MSPATFLESGMCVVVVRMKRGTTTTQSSSNTAVAQNISFSSKLKHRRIKMYPPNVKRATGREILEIGYDTRVVAMEGFVVTVGVDVVNEGCFYSIGRLFL